MPAASLSRIALVAVVLGSFALFAIWIGGSEAASLPKADRILVVKSERKLTLLRDGKPLKSYLVALGGVPVGDKKCQGDSRTPEGVYRIDFKKKDSQFHRALHVSYPDARDVAEARKRGCPPGGDIMIHGLASSFAKIGALHRLSDWTLGCIAVTNEEIEEIWAAVDTGTTVEIRP
jgi:murein L,D-transpeptidase YafK